MQFTEEHNELRRTVARFVKDELNPHVDEWEKAGILPGHELIKKAAELGLMGINKPTEYGGLGLDFSYQAAFCEEVGGVEHGATGLMFAVQTMMATPALAQFGSDELRQEFLAPAIAGDYMCSIAVSEPGAGSDVAAITTTARKDGDDYVINGQKMWITHATQADFFCVLANTGEGPIHKNKSLIIVPRNTPGLSVGEKLDKLGMRASDTAPVFFDNVRVPQRYRIGEEGRGFVYQMQQFQEERMGGVLAILKPLELCISKTVEYTRERKAFGQSILDNQIVRYRLAELLTEVRLLRALTYEGVEKYCAGQDMSMEATMCKLKAGRLATEVPNATLQYWGGMGFMWENYCSRMLRDLRLTAIGGGSDETMLGVICKMMGTR